MHEPDALRKLLNSGSIHEEYKNILLNYAQEVISALETYLNYFFIHGKLKDAIIHLLGKGKLIRPIFSLLISRGLGVNDESALKLAVAIELSHTASLIHDDLIDKSDFRRGIKAVHKIFGEEIAILAGDALILISNYITSELGNAIIKESINAGIKMCLGESLELENKILSIEDYLDIVYLKTAAFFEHIARVSAMLAGIRGEMLETFGKFGKELGFAFQFRDDLLDLIGNKALIGKPINQDTNKPNLVKIISNVYHINKDEAIKIAIKMIDDKIKSALSTLEDLPLTNNIKNTFREILFAIRDRNL